MSGLLVVVSAYLAGIGDTKMYIPWVILLAFLQKFVFNVLSECASVFLLGDIGLSILQQGLGILGKTTTTTTLLRMACLQSSLHINLGQDGTEKVKPWIKFLRLILNTVNILKKKTKQNQQLKQTALYKLAGCHQIVGN